MHRKPPTIILVIGRAYVGKTLASTLLSAITRLRHDSTTGVLFDIMAAERGVTRSVLERADMDQLRDEFILKGNILCDSDPCSLVRPLLDRDVRIIDGVRRKAELGPIVKLIRSRQMRPFILWIERPSRVLDNTDLTSADAHVQVSNTGNITHLTSRLQDIVNEFNLGYEMFESSPTSQGINSNPTERI